MTNNNTSEVKKVTPEMIRKAKFTAIIYMVTVAFLLLDSGLWIFEKYTYCIDGGVPFPVCLSLAIVFGAIGIRKTVDYLKMKKEAETLY